MITAIVGRLIITTLLLIGEKLSKKKKNSNILKNYGMMIHEHIRFRRSLNTVSYTHLTLPTNREV